VESVANGGIAEEAPCETANQEKTEGETNSKKAASKSGESPNDGKVITSKDDDGGKVEAQSDDSAKGDALEVTPPTKEPNLPPPITSEAPSSINTPLLPQQIILPPPPANVPFANPATTSATTTTDQFGMRYPIIQTISSPFFSGTNASPQLIFSPEQQQYISYPEQSLTQTTDPITLPFMFDQQQQLSAFMPAPLQQQPTTKKKKKRLSKKQQQQQAQLQFQQQLLLQHIQQQQQQQLNAFTIFPQSFPFMQPMPFFQQPTTILLPNLILGQDGTLFVQQQQQQQQQAAQVQTSSVIRGAVQSQIIAPKREDAKGAAPEDELRRNNPTADSSTGDLLLGILGSSSGNSSTTTTPIPSPNVGGSSSAISAAKKVTKSRAVSSTSVKRVFHQKQILPKIDSSTHPSE